MAEILTLIQENKEALESVLKSQNEFWTSYSFWINTVIGLIGVLFSVLSWIAAKNAKEAARKAKVSISIHTVETDLIQARSKLQEIKSDISYIEMRKIILDIVPELDRIKSVLEVSHIINQDLLLKFPLLGTNILNSLEKTKPSSSNSNTFKKTIVFDGMEQTLTDSIRFLSQVIGQIQAKNIEGDTNEY